MDYLTLKNRDSVPPGGWTVQDPDTKQVVRGATLSLLTSAVITQRKINNIPVPHDIVALVEHWLCERLHPGIVNIPSLAISRPRGLSEFTVRRVMNSVMQAFRLDGKPRVDLKTAEARALICSNCSANVDNAACLSCRGLVGWATGWVGRTSSFDRHLHVCNVTAEMLVASIHIKYTTRMKLNDEVLARLPEACWRREKGSHGQETIAS